MALWTPYAQSGPLDLRLPVVKVEHVSPDLPEASSSLPINARPVPLVHHPHHAGYAHPCQRQLAIPRPTAQVPRESASRVAYLSPPPAPLNPPPAAPSPPLPGLYEGDSLAEDREYQAYERDALSAMAERNGGSLLGNNPRMRRAMQASQSTADDAYRRQRERNNFAAKQSRDRRKLREVKLALQVSYLKKKMAEMKAELATRTCRRCRQRP